MELVFLFGTIGFWLLAAIAFILVMLSLENKRWGGTGATLTMVLFFVTLYYLGGQTLPSFFSFIKDNPITCILYVLGYVSIGVIWSFVKWYYFLLNYKDTIDKRNPDWKKWIPQASSYKGRIIAWMTYWPMSALWTIINDPIRRLFNRLHKKLDKVYQKISDRVFRDEK